MKLFTCRLQVTESGEILYDFGPSLERRGSKSFGEILGEVADLLWRGFKIVFKIWIAVMLVVYFAVFVLIVIAVTLALASKNDDNDFSLDWIGDLFGDLFLAAGRGMILVNMSDSYGYQHRAYKQVKRRDGKVEGKKRFVQSVYDFVFGPPRPEFDPFANDREVLAWLRENRGVLTSTEIVALAGWTFPEAEERLTEYLTRFKGNADITDEGVLIGKFEEVLARGDAAMDGGKVELFWHEFEAPFELTGNTTGKNVLIGAMNAFTFLMSAIVLFSPEVNANAEFYAGEATSMITTMHVLLGWIPFTFSLLFFSIPLLRYFRVSKEEARRLERNKRRRIVRVIFDTAGYPLKLDDVLAAVNRGGMAQLSRAEVERLLNALLLDLQGNSDVAEDGTILYRFPRIDREIASVKAVRGSGGVSKDLGSVLFDTGS
jgi:hypothetical protein